jgi:GNAT superfamily N-acetyltransferase
MLKQQHLGAYYIILQDSQIIAQLNVTYMWSGWRNATTWWIKSVYVRPAHRRKGCFRRLYQHVRAAAAAAGAAGVRLYTHEGHAHAMVSDVLPPPCGAVAAMMDVGPPMCCHPAFALLPPCHFFS